MVERKRTFLHDAIDFVALGSHSLERDDFSDCFATVPAEEMPKSGILYIFSFIIRYFILLPLKLVTLLIGILCIGMLFLYGRYLRKFQIIQDSLILFNKLIILVLNCKIVNRGVKKHIKEPHVYVSNHTSFIDYVVLSSYKFSHACIAENHSGLFGLILKHILAKNGSIGFKRSDKQDREHVLAKIKAHIHKNKAPMLMFPEGTCVNNESVVLFQKGAFDLDTLICPVGIRYSKDLLDPYWNRRVHGFTLHLFYLLTRWRVTVEVCWMPPVKRNENEDSVSFAHRVKTAIAKEMNLKNTLWNGYFKSSPVLKDREMLKTCFSTVYKKLKKPKFCEDQEDDIKKNRTYLLDENINCDERDNKVYFGAVSYKSYINNCCKEYLRSKGAAKTFASPV